MSFLLIAARADPLIHVTLQVAFAGYPDVEVILDRRHGERRRDSSMPFGGREHRFGDRRSVDVNPLLQRTGWVLVETPAR
jgi:hypothetical protein